jgi:hypothetical protein
MADKKPKTGKKSSAKGSRKSEGKELKDNRIYE